MTSPAMNAMSEKSRFVTHTDRCRLGALLTTRDADAWGDARWRAGLELFLEHARPVESQLAPESLVTMNTSAILVDLRTAKKRTVTLVYPEDIDLAADGISIFEPLGTALLGCQAGDVIECPDGSCGQRLHVVGIVYQPEQAEAHHL